MARYGKKSWVPWCGSLAAEVLSLLLNESCGSALRPAERSELRRRWLLLGLFLLWPPFFDSVFRSKPCVACYNAVDKVPLVRKVQSLPFLLSSSLCLLLHLETLHFTLCVCFVLVNRNGLSVPPGVQELSL